MNDSSKKKKRRSYRLGRRAEAAEETRRIIVEATFELHGERGIAETSMKDIADRAGVSIGTVYHHFPTYPDAIRACGAHTVERFPAPTAAIFDGAATRPKRIERLAGALFNYYENIPALPSVRRDRHLAEVLEQFVEAEADNRLELATLALGSRTRGGPKASVVAVVAALFDLDVYRALRRQGFNTTEAAERIAVVVNCWLDKAQEST